MNTPPDLSKIKNTLLFKGMSDTEINEMLPLLRHESKQYEKGEMILSAGSTTDALGLLLTGSATIESNDVWGNRTILSMVGPGHFFAETYAFLKDEPLLVDVVANEQCLILFLHIGQIRELCNQGYSWAIKMTLNLLTISSHKNLNLSGRSFHTSPKTIRGRVMSYLYAISVKKGSMEIDIPFDRQQLADYLNLERSALSKELGKMQREGLISVRKNHFILRKQHFSDQI